MGKRDDDTPWTEEQWEQFMRTGDLRAARYGELMETLLDHPDRDDIIDKEMGWDRKRDDTDREWLAELEQARAEDDGDDEFADDDGEAPEANEPKPASQSEQIDSMRQRRRGELHAIAAYVLCEETSHLIDLVVQPLLDASHDEDHDLAEAFIQIKIACAKIAGGHGMGYEDEMLGGNVVNCKRALAATGDCVAALHALVQRGLITSVQARPLLERVAAAGTAVEARIAELRGRMWWQKP